MQILWGILKSMAILYVGFLVYLMARMFGWI